MSIHNSRDVFPPTIKTFIFNALPLAENIEIIFGKYLIPIETGIYIVGRIKPAMVPNEYYYRKNYDRSNGNLTITDIQVKTIDDINGNVYNIDGATVIPMIKKQMLSNEPTVPVQGLRLVFAFIDLILIENSAWITNRHINSETILRQFIKPEWQDSPNIYAMIEDILIGIKTDLLSFIGTNKWIMHTAKNIGSDVLIEQLIDFRIYQWTLEHDPKYKGQVQNF